MDNTFERLKALPEMFEGLAWVFRSFAVVAQKTDHPSVGAVRGKSFLLYADELERLAAKISMNVQCGDPLECIDTLQDFFGLLNEILDNGSYKSSFEIWEKEVLPTIEKVGPEAGKLLNELRASVDGHPDEIDRHGISKTENTLERLKDLPEMYEELSWVFRSFALVEQRKDHSSVGVSCAISFFLHANRLEKLAMEIRDNIQRGDTLECIYTLQVFFGMSRAIFDAAPLWDEWKTEVLPTFDKVGNESAQILDELRALRKKNEQSPTP